MLNLKKIIFFIFLFPVMTIPTVSASDFFEISVGGRGFGGGNYITEPSDPLTNGRSLPFEDRAGGWAAGGGLQSEFRVLWGYLGLEFSLLFDHSENWCEIKHSVGNFYQKNRYLFSFTSLRMPLLLKGNLSFGIFRLSLGTGATFSVGLSENASISVKDSSAGIESDVSALNDNFSAERQNDILWTSSLGMAVKVWRLAVTFDFMYSYNTTQPESYTERVDIKMNNGELTGLSVNAANNMDARILVGVSYEFGL